MKTRFRTRLKRLALAFTLLAILYAFQSISKDAFIAAFFIVTMVLASAWAEGDLRIAVSVRLTGWYPASLKKHAESANEENGDETDDLGRTELFHAIDENAIDRARLLLTKGANPNRHDSHGCIPLHNACEENRIELVHLLLDHGANARWRDPYGRTPLSIAIEGQRIEIIRLLLERLEPKDLQFNDSLGRTPIIQACEKNQIEIVRLLLERNASPDVCDPYGRTPLMIAVEENRIEIARMLLEKSFDLDAQQHNRFGQTPLMRSRELGHHEIANMISHRQAWLESPALGAPPFSWLQEDR